MTESLEDLLKKHKGFDNLARVLIDSDEYTYLGNTFAKGVNSYFTSDTIRILRTSKEVPEECGHVALQGIKEYLIDRVGAKFLVNYDPDEIYPEIQKQLLQDTGENGLNTFTIDNSYTLSKTLIDIKEHILLIHDEEFFSDKSKRVGGLALGNKHIAIVQSTRYTKGRFREGKYCLTKSNERKEYFKRLCAHETAHLIFNMVDLGSPKEHDEFGIPVAHNCLSTSNYADNAAFCEGCLQTFKLYQAAKKIKTGQFEPFFR